jgi:transposase
VAIGKYLDHAPLERQVRMMRREGLEIDSQTLWDQLEYLARLHADLPGRLLKYLLSKRVLGADETTWRLMESLKKKPRKRKKWYVWALCGDDGVVYRITESHSSESAKELLAGYQGTLMTDGYAVYERLRKEGEGYALVHCWSHVRRKFLDAEQFYLRPSRAIVNLIDELFAVERLCPRGPPDKEEERLALLKALRQERSRYILNAIEIWLLELPREVLPKSAIGKAVSYTTKLWPGLCRFIDDPLIPLSNNGTERSIRGVVVGRKNHYGSRSLRGTEVAALFYTVLESAKLADVDPHAYLRSATLAAIRGEQVLLPHEVDQGADMSPPVSP